MAYLFINRGWSRRPRFVSDRQVEDNWEKAFGGKNPVEDRLDTKLKDEKEKEEIRVLECGHCGNTVRFKYGMSAFCPSCKTGTMSFVRGHGQVGTAAYRPGEVV